MFQTFYGKHFYWRIRVIICFNSFSVKDCGKGKYYHEKKCCLCQQGTFQQQDGTFINCTQCPRGMSTLTRGSESLANCKSKNNTVSVSCHVRTQRCFTQGS